MNHHYYLLFPKIIGFSLIPSITFRLNLFDIICLHLNLVNDDCVIYIKYKYLIYA